MKDATNSDFLGQNRRMSLNEVDLMTTEELIDIIASRQDSCGCLFFMSYEDDEDTDAVYFHTNMKQDQFNEMLDVFKDWIEDNIPEWEEEDDYDE